MTDDDDLTDDERLEEALLDVIAALVPAIGLPPDVDGGPRVAPPGCTLVDPDRIPAGALYTAAKALDMIALALSVLRGQCDTPVTLKEGLAILDRQNRRAC